MAEAEFIVSCAPALFSFHALHISRGGSVSIVASFWGTHSQAHASIEYNIPTVLRGHRQSRNTWLSQLSLCLGKAEPSSMTMVLFGAGNNVNHP